MYPTLADGARIACGDLGAAANDSAGTQAGMHPESRLDRYATLDNYEPALRDRIWRVSPVLNPTCF
jgi:hypothetical protein